MALVVGNRGGAKLMGLPRFELHRVTTVNQATELLDRYGDDAALHCGGTELLLAMKLGFAPYKHLIDIKPVAELRGITVNSDLCIGANTTHRQVEQHPDIRTRWAGFAEMAASIGNLRVRNVGTVGGNLCFAEPHSDPATALLALGAALECRRGNERARILAMEDFVIGPFQTAMRPGEVLLGIRIPPLVNGAALLHRKITFHERAAATVTMTCRVTDNRVDHFRLAVGAVGNKPALVPEASELIAAASADALPPHLLDELCEAAVLAGQVVTDMYGSADYKSHLLRVLVRRTLADATDRLKAKP